MKLTDEQVSHLKRNAEIGNGVTVTFCASTIMSMFDTIEALRQENEQLQAQNGAMREALEIVNSKIKLEQTISGECGMIYVPLMTIREIKKIQEALSTTPTTYHNPADVEALAKAREALFVGQYWTKHYEHLASLEQIEEAIAAIDKAVVGNEIF